jgi:formate C-acetyltransferase
LTSLALHVSRDVCLIDPKINLRISASTDLELLTLATELTRKGLGFPQYCNDDVVIPGLVACGYRLEDARDYAIAACWEFLVPGKAMDVVNIGAVSFPAAVDQALRDGFSAGEDMPQMLQRVKGNIAQQVSDLACAYERLLLPPAPYYSVLMTDCLEEGRDISEGAQYNNFGIHGAGSANAADALAAIQEFVFREKSVQPREILAALDADYEGFEDLRVKLAEKGPKTGNDDDRADRFLVALFQMLAEACEGYGTTSRKGILRPGSGSAMYYLWLAQGHPGMREPQVGATAEGRCSGRPFGANLAPSQGVQIRGPFSLLLSYSKLDYRRICNGGPITMELSDSVFRDDESVRKVSLLIRAFAQLGCQQLQLNSVNVETLRDAKIHPELHKNLIVRVWGWSGYFCELAPEYQDQIIGRHVFAAG